MWARSRTPATGWRRSSSQRGTAFVRLSAEKLDALLTRSGELLVARRRVESRAEDLAALREFVGRWRADWRSAEKPLGKLLPRHGNGKEGGPLPRRAAETLIR